MITFATAVVPIRHPNRFPIIGPLDENIDEYDELLGSYLVQLLDVIPMIDGNIEVISIEKVEPTESQINHLNIDNKLLVPSMHDYIEITISYKNDIETMRKNNLQMKDSSDEELVRWSAACMLAHSLEKAHFFAEIAFPGLLDVYSGLAFEDNQPVIAVSKKNTFRFVLEDRLRKASKWPSVLELQLSSVISWSEKIGFGNGYYAKTRMQRTLASYAHVISLGWSREGESLFRIVQALEAFYTNGNGDLRNQLSEKSKLFLVGENLQTNLVGKLYDMRSKFIHGSAVINYPNGWGQEVEEEEKVDTKKTNEFNQAVEFGFKLLVASIQKCVRENVVDMNWGYTYAPENG